MDQIPTQEAVPATPAAQETQPTEQVPISENRELLFGKSQETTPVAQETPAQEAVAPVQEETAPTEEGLETPEVSEGLDLDIINLGSPQQAAEKGSQEAPQVDELAAAKEQIALLTRIVNEGLGKDSSVQQPPQQEEVKKKPEFKDYKDDQNLSSEEATAKYAEDLAGWSAEQAVNKVMADHKAAETLNKQQKADIDLRESFNRGIPEAEKRYGNKFSEALLNSSPNVPIDCMREILGAEKAFNTPGLSHDIIYHLCKRKDVVGQLNSVSSVKAGVMIGTIAQKIINLKAAKTKNITQTPKPLQIVKPGAKATEAQPAGTTTPLKTLVSKPGGQRHAVK
jgi:hypothetical protein